MRKAAKAKKRSGQGPRWGAWLRRAQRALTTVGIGIGIGVAIAIGIAIEFVTGRLLFHHEGHEGHEGISGQGPRWLAWLRRAQRAAGIGIGIGIGVAIGIAIENERVRDFCVANTFGLVRVRVRVVVAGSKVGKRVVDRESDLDCDTDCDPDTDSDVGKRLRSPSLLDLIQKREIKRRRCGSTAERFICRLSCPRGSG